MTIRGGISCFYAHTYGSKYVVVVVFLPVFLLENSNSCSTSRYTHARYNSGAVTAFYSVDDALVL